MSRPSLQTLLGASFLLALTLFAGCLAFDPWIQVRAGASGIQVTIERDGRIPKDGAPIVVYPSVVLTPNETSIVVPSE